MKDFMLLFRQPSYDYSSASPQEMQALAKKWRDRVGGIAAQGKLSSNGPRLSTEGKVLKAGGVITDGPFVEIREMLGRCSSRISSCRRILLRPSSPPVRWRTAPRRHSPKW